MKVSRNPEPETIIPDLVKTAGHLISPKELVECCQRLATEAHLRAQSNALDQ
jgi:hypothetical protein